MRVDAESSKQPPPTMGRLWLHALPRLIEALAVNAIPLWGLFHGWSFGTLLLLYWCENLLNTIFVGGRIWIHRRLTNLQGDWRVDQAATMTVSVTTGHGKQQTWKSTSFLQSFVVTNLVFSLAQGIIILFVVMGLLDSPPAQTDLGRGALLLLAAMTVGFFLDLPGLRRRPAAWVRARAESALGRTVVVHLGVIGGAILLIVTHRQASFFVVFVLLKVLLEVGSAFPKASLLANPSGSAKTSAERDDEKVRRSPTR
jgi:hypothetical protein